MLLFLSCRERVYYTRTSESLESAITSLLFSKVSKLLTLGLADGSVALLDIETNDIVPARRTEDASSECSVTSLAWQSLPALKLSMVNMDLLAVHGGLHQFQRGGMSEYSDPTAVASLNVVDGISLALTSPVTARWELINLLSGNLLLAPTQDGRIDGYILGVYPLFSVSAGLLGAPSRLFSAPVDITNTLCFDTTTTGCRMLHWPSSLHERLRWYEHCGSLHLCIESNLSRLHDLVLSCGRKWKDACKVILPKLSLMQTLLTSYEMQMTPIEFCYSITLCGLWHPAAATAFSQHWNDQGLQRLRAAVDSTSRSIVKLLQTKALPMVTNSLLCARYVVPTLWLLVSLNTAQNRVCSNFSKVCP
jgi:hypothetical protein